MPNNGQESYPREDKCKVCGDHIGWILNEIGEAMALGLCDKQDEQHNQERKNNE